MKKTFLYLFILFLVFSLTISAKSIQPTSLAPENTKWLIHLDVEKFVSTQLFDFLLADKKNDITKFNDMLDRKFKIDLFKDISGISIIGLGKSKDNTVLCWEGKIDREFVLSLLKLNNKFKEIPHGNYTIYSWDNHFGTFANDHLALLSENKDAILKVLDVMAGKRKAESALMVYWRSIPPDAFIKAAAHDIAELGDNEASEILKKAGMAFFMGIENNGNLRLKLELTTDTPETAYNIQQIVKGFMALAEMKKKDDRTDKHLKLLKLLDHIKIKVEKNVMQIEFTYPSKDLVNLLSQLEKCK
jgi:hypothetical protein